MEANLISCPVCKGTVASTAKVCPHCGNPNPKKEPEKPITPAENVGHGLGITGFTLALLSIFTFVLPWAALALLCSLLALAFSSVGLGMGRKKGLAAAGLLISLFTSFIAFIAVAASK